MQWFIGISGTIFGYIIIQIVGEIAVEIIKSILQKSVKDNHRIIIYSFVGILALFTIILVIYTVFWR